ncbi:MAG: peptide deformylase [bacterium]
MAVLPIIKYGNPILRVQTSPVAEITEEHRILVDDMIETMQEAEGVGLAAPQVAESIAVCIVDLGLIEEGAAPKAYINPVILQVEGSESLEEGCLSIPDIREEVIRPQIIQVKYLDLYGTEHEEVCGGMLSRVLQHEIDHLNGVLFIDRISSIKRKLLAKKLKRIAEKSGRTNGVAAHMVKGAL